MKNIPIILRGHHLKLLYEHYIEGDTLHEIEKEIEKDFGGIMAKNLISILSKIVNEECKLIFTDGLDSICEKCPNVTRECYDALASYQDKVCIKGYGLITEIPYSSQEVLKKLKEKDGSFMYNILKRLVGA